MRCDMRAILVACLFATVAFWPGFSDAHGIPGAHSEGYIADVLVVDLNCEENHTVYFYCYVFCLYFKRICL